MMTKNKKIKLTIEAEGTTQTFEGPVDDAFKFMSKFISQVYPTIRYASKFIYSPDLAGLFEALSKYLQVAEDGSLLFDHRPESAEQAIGMMLLGSLLSQKLGLRNRETLSSSEIIQQADKAPKTIRNTLAYMVKSNLVERVSKGEYKMTVRGVKWMENALRRMESRSEGD